MRIAALTNVADDSRTMLRGGLTQQWRLPLRARTNAFSVIAALPFAF